MGFRGEIQRLKEGLFDLYVVKQVDAKKIHHLELEIRQLKKNISEVDNYVVDQHKLDFSKALQHAKYFYKFPLDGVNF